MDYFEAKDYIESGDLLAWSGHSFFSRMIKLFTESSITHVGIAYKVNTELFVIESIEGTGVRLFPLHRRIPFFWIKPIPREYHWNSIIKETALKRIGEEYSLWGCLKALFKKSLKKDKYWQCAEFASYILSLMGYSTNGYNTPHTLVQKMFEEDCILIKVTKKK